MEGILLRPAIVAALALCGAVAHATTVVWDQGPSTGTFGGSWSNTTSDQNFADAVTLTQDTSVGGLNYYTDFDLSGQTGSADFHLKILADNGGAPGRVLYSADLGYASYASGFSTQDGVLVNQLHFDFGSVLFSAGTTYWVGLSGNGFEAAQTSVLAPQDGLMAQFAGRKYTFMANIGDQMFQLTSAVPEPGTYALLLVGLTTVGGVAAYRRRAS